MTGSAVRLVSQRLQLIRRVVRWTAPKLMRLGTMSIVWCAMQFVAPDGIFGQDAFGHPGWYAGARTALAVPRGSQFYDWDAAMGIVGIAGRRMTDHIEVAVGVTYGTYGTRSRIALVSGDASTGSVVGGSGKRMTRAYIETRYSQLCSEFIEPFLAARVGWVGKEEDWFNRSLSSSGVELGLGLGVLLWTGRHLAFEFGASESRVYLGDEKLSATYAFPRAAWHNIVDFWAGVRFAT